jgi:hypothetical protein
MNTPSTTIDEVEQERLEQVAELVADSGQDWARQFEPGTTGCHELLDRAAMFADMLERHLVGHPACVANPDWYRLAERAAAALNELYQSIGAEHLKEER